MSSRITQVHQQGDTTTYEWAIQAFSHYPDAPTRLEPGETLGFDVYAIDRDGHWDAPPALVCWGLAGGPKFLDAGLLGDLILVEKAEDVPASAVSSP